MNENCPELVFGLVGAIGTNLEHVQNCLSDQLESVGYETVNVKLSDLMRELCELNLKWYDFPAKTDTDYYERAMKCGNKLRADLKRADAVAGLAIASIKRRRMKNKSVDKLPKKRAYILSSLKRQEEVALLRDVYGASLFIISAYSPRASRVDRLASQLAEREFQNRIATHRGLAEDLILKDENESGDFGQDVRRTYPQGDLFVDASRLTESSGAIERFVALLFGDPWRTPSRDEQGMAFAHLASLRSASPARQVGAALTDQRGDLLAVGTNEVASPGGGQYWEGDTGDGRDVMYDQSDTSDRMRRNLLSDVLVRLKDLGVFNEKWSDPNRLLEAESESFRLLRKAQLFDTIDFIRAVHAEASALFGATGRTRDSTLYVTTFPCHECARHIVICGVRRVVYIEPYPKSLVAELFRDSIDVDQDDSNQGRVHFVPFTGISPATYQQFFLLTKKQRKEKDGTLVRWNAKDAKPHLHISFSERATQTAETEALDKFRAELRKEGIADDSVSGTAGEGLVTDGSQ